MAMRFFSYIFYCLYLLKRCVHRFADISVFAVVDSVVGSVVGSDVGLLVGPQPVINIIRAMSTGKKIFFFIISFLLN